MDDGSSQEEYIRRVLEAYRKTPGTMGTIRRPDRVLAVQLYQRGSVQTSATGSFLPSAEAPRTPNPHILTDGVGDSARMTAIRKLAVLPVVRSSLTPQGRVGPADCYETHQESAHQPLAERQCPT
jgi:hypothetical protein